MRVSSGNVRARRGNAPEDAARWLPQLRPSGGARAHRPPLAPPSHSASAACRRNMLV